MDIIWLCFRCPGRFSELLPDDPDPGVSEIIVEDLVSLALKILPFIAIVDRVEIDFLRPKNMYAIQVRIWCYGRFKDYPDEEDIGVIIERLVRQALLQLFWEVSIQDSDC